MKETLVTDVLKSLNLAIAKAILATVMILNIPIATTTISGDRYYLPFY